MARVVAPQDGASGYLGSIGFRSLVAGEESGGGFTLVEHPMPPRALGSPLHRHNREDEYDLDMQPDSVPGLLERFDLRIGEPG
jgi:hypothetical protein